MSMKPEVITRNQIAEQTHAMTQQRDHLQSQVLQLDHRLKMIENSLAENETLRKKVHELSEVSLEHFKIEWKRKGEFYPDIRAGFLQKTIDALAPK